MLLFQPYRLDVVNQQLLRDDANVPLMPKPFAVLQYLVEHAGRLITQHELLGHMSRAMLERYSHIRMAAKRKALDAIVQGSERSDFGEVVHQNVHQFRRSASDTSSKHELVGGREGIRTPDPLLANKAG